MVGKVAFEPENGSKYSGIFKGSDYGIIRLSSAYRHSMTPGMALKFMRDGLPSSNVLAMHSMDAQINWDFFANDLSNHIEKPIDRTARMLAAKFISATTNV